MDSSKKLNGLCKKCSQINFAQFASPPTLSQNNNAEDSTDFLLHLYDIIENARYRICKFCKILFDSIASPMHDPFKHPAIKDYMPPEFQGKTFEIWAKEQKWGRKLRTNPFGKSRNKVKLEQTQNNEGASNAAVTEVRGKGQETIHQAGVISVATGTGAGIQAASQEKDKDLKKFLSIVSEMSETALLFIAGMENTLPAAVSIKIHDTVHADAGLISVEVLGYGNKVQAPLSVLSSFNLRAASNYQEDGLRLRYGKILSEFVNVKEDCRKWLARCRQHHGNLCANPDWSTKLPPPSGKHFRLIEIENEDNNFKVVQVNADDQVFLPRGTIPEYTALSYVWGDAGEKALNLLLRNVSLLSMRIPPAKVARIILDAIKVTKQLGIRYIWVDSLCVIQNGGDGEDEPEARQSQLNQMGSIFGHAAVVIVAAGGEDAEAGLAGITSPRKPGQIAQEVQPNVNVLLPVQYDQSYGKWDTRAWTLQEKLLSKRMLVFDRNHVSFHCRHGVLREDMPAAHASNSPPQMPYLSPRPDCGISQVTENWHGTLVLLRSPFFDEYARLLEQYTSRDRSKSDDVLKAILGLLRVLENMRNFGSLGFSRAAERQDNESQDHTLYGLPEEFLDLALLWQPPAVMGMHLTKRANDLFPSWSWAGWEAGKDPSHGQNAASSFQAHPGVRFEEPFWVSGNDDTSLRKFMATGNHAEERFRPLLMWYKWVDDSEPSKPVSSPLGKPDPPRKPRHLIGGSTERSQPSGKLEPVNGYGVGIVCGSRDAETRFLAKVLEFRKPHKDLCPEPGPPSVKFRTPLNRRHLVCETQVGTFRLRQDKKTPRKEFLWKQIDENVVVAKELEILEAEILDESNNVVGYVIPTDQRKIITDDPYNFIILSESQYWGNEKRIDVVGFPLYNVMVVEWDTKNEFATRLGLGKISKSAWRARNPSKRCVILK